MLNQTSVFPMLDLYYFEFLCFTSCSIVIPEFKNSIGYKLLYSLLEKMMTISTFTLLAVTGSLFLLKLALMALVVLLLVKTLSTDRTISGSSRFMSKFFRLGSKAHFSGSDLRN